MGVNGATVNKTLWQICFNSAFDTSSDLFPENTIGISGLTKVKHTEVSQQTHISPFGGQSFKTPREDAGSDFLYLEMWPVLALVLVTYQTHLFC